MTRRASARRPRPAPMPPANAWAGFTRRELETKLAELRKLVDGGRLSARSLDHQCAEIGIIERELAARDGG